MTDSPDPAAVQAELATALDFTPVPRRFNRGDVWTEEVQRAFIEALADTGSVEAACRMVGRSPASAYRLRRHPLGAGFAAAWQAAADFGIRRIEDYAIDRATNGIEVPVFAYGDKIATRRVYNDQLVMFMLRSRLPKRYCDGGARGMSAVDKHVLERFKKQWRAEWEQERQLLEHEKEKKTFEEIDQWIDTMRENRWNNMSPRARAAYEEADRIAKEDGVAWMDAEIEAEEDDGEVSVPLLPEPEREAEGDTGAEAEPRCAKPPLDLARAQILGAVEARIRQLEVREDEGDGRQDSGTAGPGDIRAEQAPSDRCADTSPVNGGGSDAANPPPFTGEGNHDAQRSGGGGQGADPEQAPSGSLRSPPPP